MPDANKEATLNAVSVQSLLLENFLFPFVFVPQSFFLCSFYS